jgi:hypothetical protein
MPTITIPDVTIRTTSDGAGHAHGLALGTGLTLDGALQALTAEALRQAGEIAETYRGADHDSQPDAEWRFEVVDMRIVIGPEGSRDESWCCYGTLCSTGATPWSASFWDQRH